MSFGNAQPGLGKAVRVLRNRAGLSRAELAVRAELDATSVSRIEAGAIDPTWGSMRRIAKGLGVSLRELAEEAERQ
ncbi:MAG TPA: helix-turn-helix transcriptional regulator [Solirubrobacterales bacterium]|nr:helix-turn-helix transcriptional regulator [Solirubrobacterales bacterium]